MVVQLTRFDLQEEVIANPVRLDHLWIQRIADDRRSSDQSKVRHRATESTQQLGQAAIDGRGDRVVVERAVVVATAVTQTVRHKGIMGKTKRAAERRRWLSSDQMGVSSCARASIAPSA